MISFSKVQDLASDLEFAATMLSPSPEIDEHESWLIGGADGELIRERVRVAESIKLAAEILNHLTIEQVEALPSYLRAA